MKRLTLTLGMLALALSLGIGFLARPGEADAKSMVLKVSHQFAAGDVRDRMGRVFGDRVTEKTNGEITFRLGEEAYVVPVVEP